jgi:hypothetical protein
VDDPAPIGFIAEWIDRLMTFDAQWQSVLQSGYYVAAGVVLATLFLIPPRFRRVPPPAKPLHAPEPAPDSSTITEAATAIPPP